MFELSHLSGLMPYALIAWFYMVMAFQGYDTYFDQAEYEAPTISEVQLHDNEAGSANFVTSCHQALTARQLSSPPPLCRQVPQQRIIRPVTLYKLFIQGSLPLRSPPAVL